MRGDGPDGRQGAPPRGDAAELDVLPPPAGHGATPAPDAAWPDDGWTDDDWTDDDWTDDDWTAEEWTAEDENGDVQPVDLRSRPPAPDPLDEADALYDDGEDDPARWDAAAAWPAPHRSEVYGDADDEGYEGAYEDDDGYDDGHAYGGANGDADRRSPASVAYHEGVDAEDDPYAEGAYDEDDPYGEGDEGYDPAWLEPEVATAAAAPAGGGPAEPAIWAPGTAPGAWVPLGRPRFGNPLPDPGRLTVRTRRRNLSVFSLAGITNVVLFGYAVTALLLAAFTAALGRRLAALQGVDEAAARADALARSEYLVDVTARGVLALLAATIVASMVWTGVAARNQRLLGDDRTLMPPVLAVVGWLVPVVNLYVPLRAVSEAASGPFRTERVPGTALRWWLSWLVAVAACGYSLRAALSTADDAVPGTIKGLTIVTAAATVLFLYCFSQASTLLRHVARLQHDLAVERD